MDMLNLIVLALFPTLFIFAVFAAWVFWADYILPAWNQGVLSVREHKLPIALGFIVLGLAGETLLNGLTSLLPSSYLNDDQITPLVLTLKLFYFFGLIFAVGWAIKMRTKVSYLGTVTAVAVAIWGLALLALFLYHR